MLLLLWKLELPNLEVKVAVFLTYFPAYEMTSNFNTILEGPHLTTQENRQVVTAYISNQTLRKVKTLCDHYFLLKILQET